MREEEESKGKKADHGHVEGVEEENSKKGEEERLRSQCPLRGHDSNDLRSPTRPQSFLYLLIVPNWRTRNLWAFGAPSEPS